MLEIKKIKMLKDIIKQTDSALFLKALQDQSAKEEIKKLLENQTQIITNDDELNYAYDQIVGLGIFEKLIADEKITDIGFNGTRLFIDSSDGKREYNHDVTEEEVKVVIERFAQGVDREFSPKHPILDAQLNNVRINAVHEVIARQGTTMSMRMARPRRVLNESNFHLMAPMEVHDLLKGFVEAGSNIIISGEVGTGKTELQKLLVGFIPNQKKTIMIEDVLETHLKTLYPEKDILSWLVTANASYSDLIKAGLRNNPDYLIVSEIRGNEASDFYDGVLSSHSGITSIHAMGVRAIEDRFINMIKKTDPTLDVPSYRHDIYRYFNLAIHIEKTVVNDKVRRYISEVAEYTEDGLKTLYKQTMRHNQEASYSVHFGMISEETEEKFNKFGVSLDWNKFVSELRNRQTSGKEKKGYIFV